MYAIYAYIGVVLGVNVGIYGIHGVSGIDLTATRAPYWVNSRGANPVSSDGAL